VLTTLPSCSSQGRFSECICTSLNKILQKKKGQLLFSEQLHDRCEVLNVFIFLSSYRLHIFMVILCNVWLSFTE